jgi:hypothetical protein
MRLVATLGLFALFLAAVAGPQKGTKLYKSGSFDIRYPSGFKVRKSSEDSAFFTSPDKSVEFYVLSPLWNGDPKEILLHATTEKVVSEKTEKKGQVVVYRATFQAKNGSYLRSVEDTENKEFNTRHTFGFKFSNEKAAAKYRKAYLAFKASLRQYGD